MLSKSDFTKLKEIFVTKDEFRELKEIFVTKDEFKELKGMVHEVIFELRSMREEVILIAHRNRENSDNLELHNSRITNLEEKLSF